MEINYSIITKKLDLIVKVSGSLILNFLICIVCQAQPARTGKIANRYIADKEVKWTTLGKDENDSMPIGNGDLAANVWTESNGDVVILVAKADAWTETGNLVKLGRIRVRLTPNPFNGPRNFTQVLKLESGTIEIKQGGNKVLIWADALHPVMHVEAYLTNPGRLSAIVEPWRKANNIAQWPAGADYSEVMAGRTTPEDEPDIIFPATKNQLSWCHYNPDSYYPYLLRQQHLESLLSKFEDPLNHRSFGALLKGPGLISTDNQTLRSASPAKYLRLDLYALTQLQTSSPDSWQKSMQKMVTAKWNNEIKNTRLEHEKWWMNFWDRSWINVSGTAETGQISQGYAIQRYMMATSSRGEFPIKFNGGLFTVGHDVPENFKQTKDIHNPDYRNWGDHYWNQNNRLLYWPLIASGDNDLIRPWYQMYMKALPLARAQTMLYYHHDGASFPETMHFWGLPRLKDFGKDNPTNEIQSHWQRYHTQGALEVVAQMLDTYDYQPDALFARNNLVPLADAIITYYYKHWKPDVNGKILMSPTQSLETYQLDAVNPTPDIAGLMNVLPRLLALPAELTNPAQRSVWSETLKSLPPIPMGKTAKGKVPPLGAGDPDGIPVILPAQAYGKPGNAENPELYVTFPYRLYGMGKPDLELARNTFAARRSPQNTCWGQDGTQGAILGLTDVAEKAVVSEFTNYGNQRFQWFWKPSHDYIPDLDNGGSGMITLQNMLMQCDGKRIQLLPAWPSSWTADFKLHAPFRTTVEGHVENGRVTRLKVIPAERTKDVIILATAN
jgi:alpha-L-fucosidase 2